jgi:hypothetical protein
LLIPKPPPVVGRPSNVNSSDRHKPVATRLRRSSHPELKSKRFGLPL